jgi:cell division septation protein DedD
VTGNGPQDDDPSEAPTGYYDYSGYGDKQGDPKRGTPWYRRPIITLALALFVAILLGLVFYLLADQGSGTGHTTQTPTSPTTSTGVTTTPPEATTTTEPSAPPETTMTFPPTTTEPAPTTTAPTTTPTPSPSTDDGRHHHHHRDGGTP